MSLEVSGKVVQILDVVNGTSAKGEWKKREFIIETAEQYPKSICLAAWGDQVDIVSTFKVGDEVRCGIEINSREYNDRWYTDIRAWKPEKVSGSTQPAAKPATGENYSSEEVDDLPF